MDINASDIYSFYNSRLGTIVKRNIRHQLNTHLNSVNDSVICGYGYTNPFLSFLSKQNKNLQISSMQPEFLDCLLYTSPSPRDVEESRMPSSA